MPWHAVTGTEGPAGLEAHPEAEAQVGSFAMEVEGTDPTCRPGGVIKLESKIFFNLAHESRFFGLSQTFFCCLTTSLRVI